VTFSLCSARWNLAIHGVRRFGAAETEEVLQLNLGLQSAKTIFRANSPDAAADRQHLSDSLLGSSSRVPEV
jgi:hypothetical protein